jgi:hypothetical protein
MSMWIQGVRSQKKTEDRRRKKSKEEAEVERAKWFLAGVGFAGCCRFFCFFWADVCTFGGAGGGIKKGDKRI